MKTIQLYLLSLLSGLLLAFAWFPHGWVPLIFVAFVPLLLVERQVAANPGNYHTLTLFGCSYLSFFTWNLLTTWWVKNASYGGAALAIICNALLMTTVFIMFHRVKRRTGAKWEYLIFCSFWITFEFLHLDWDLSWPWLTLGNAFADTRNLIQWYEYTGAFGGSLWVLAVNCIFASCFEKTATAFSFRFNKKKMITGSVVLLVPVVISCLIVSAFPLGSDGIPKYSQVVVVQPNIDPYNEKFNGSVDEQIKKMLTLAAEKVNAETEYLIFPETALPEVIWENDFEKNPDIQQLREFLKPYPRLKIIIGAATARVYRTRSTATARKFRNDDGYYDDYNAALQVSSASIQVYHKSRLVPGVEKLPFPAIFKFLDKLAIDLGGTTGSLGMQNERSVFYSSGYGAAPVVCYESIYGEYVCEYIQRDANFIAIITNDGWWGDTPGYRQHLKYGALRAIETRRWIARSANTGISCFISPEGNIQQATDWWVPAVIAGQIEMRHELTFYVKYGDYIARTAMYLTLLLIIYSLLIRFRIIKK